jgi:transposase
MRADHRRCQAEKPLIVLSRFPEPALFGWRRQAMRKGTTTPSTATASGAAEVAVRPSPVIEIVVGAAVIRVGADIGEAELRRVIRAVRSA